MRKNTVKKILAALLALGAISALTACNNSQTTAQSTAESSKSVSESSTENSQESSAESSIESSVESSKAVSESSAESSKESSTESSSESYENTTEESDEGSYDDEISYIDEESYIIYDGISYNKVYVKSLQSISNEKWDQTVQREIEVKQPVVVIYSLNNSTKKFFINNRYLASNFTKDTVLIPIEDGIWGTVSSSFFNDLGPI